VIRSANVTPAGAYGEEGTLLLSVRHWSAADTLASCCQPLLLGVGRIRNCYRVRQQELPIRLDETKQRDITDLILIVPLI
jgi:hypothetical protein